MEKRHTKILIEKNEFVVWRRGTKPVVVWCPECQADTQKVKLTEAALLCQVDESRSQEWLQEGSLHVLEGPERGVLICLKSLNLRR
jgi:hypothetical protein